MSTWEKQGLSPNPSECQKIAEQMLSLAIAAGAEGAEVLLREGSELSVKVRLGATESIEEAGSRGLGLRVLKGNRVATTYTSDLAPQALRRFAEESVALCELSEPDPFAALPSREEMARSIPELDLWDEAVLSVDADRAMDWALQGEKAALGFDSRVTNSEGATFSRATGAVAFASSAGFSGAYRGSHVSLVVEPLCDDTEGKKRNGHYYTTSRYLADLMDAASVGLEAARRTVAKLGSRKIATGQFPVVFSPEAGRSLLGLWAGTMMGGSVWRKSSYLADREGTAIASPLVTLVDDPLIRQGMGSRPFDGEGLAVRINEVVSRGVLKTFLCDVYSGRRLGRTSTGSASRGLGGGPGVSTSNLVMSPGDLAPEELEKLDRGLYVTQLMGFGFNPTTGDFSQGASGFLIERGERVHPVAEITLSANFNDFWNRVDAVGRDVDNRSSIRCPSFRVASAMVAGT